MLWLQKLHGFGGSLHLLLENRVFPPYCCSDDADSTAKEPRGKEKAEDKAAEVWAGMEGWGCFNGLGVLKEGGRQLLTRDALSLFPLPRAASISFGITSEPMQSLWVVQWLELGAWS